MSLKNFLIVISVFVVGLFVTGVVLAAKCDPDDCNDEDSCREVTQACEKKLQEIDQTQQTLSNELAYFDTQISLTEARIQSSVVEIEKRTQLLGELVDDISNLQGRIDKLIESIDYQRTVLNERARARYKNGYDKPFLVIFGSSTFNELVKRTEYLKILQAQDRGVLDEMEKTRTAYTQQKDLFEEKKKETEDLKAQVEAEKRNLEAYNDQLADQKAEKQRLLAQTQNDEAKYQSLLQEAQSQAASFGNFVSSGGLGVIDANGLGKGEKGWYMSQRDERWAYTKIGKSNENIFNVGCLVTSVAMVHKKYGDDVTPASIASKSSYFFGNTALMYQPWPAPDGKSYHSISTGQIEGEVDDGHPVIVGVYAGSYGTHFVVLADTDGGDYVMYDPYYGPDLNFSDYYSTGSIFQAAVFK